MYGIRFKITVDGRVILNFIMPENLVLEFWMRNNTTRNTEITARVGFVPQRLQDSKSVEFLSFVILYIYISSIDAQVLRSVFLFWTGSGRGDQLLLKFLRMLRKGKGVPVLLTKYHAMRAYCGVEV
jgi:hypothetical protein